MGEQRDIFVSSDTHFNHANILNFMGADGKKFRGDLFKNSDEMNEHIIRQHNSVVGINDIWYCCGDVYFGREDAADNLLSRMNGKKRLILGNHDNLNAKVLFKHFEKIVLWRMFTEHKVLLTHVPVHESSFHLYSKFDLNAHGHIHEKDSPKGPYVNISMEKINYTPVHITDLHKVWKTQQDSIKN
jgi:calcineurin-like phosphoesterase family protein